MRFGIFLPPFAEFAEPQRVVALAKLAEESGWDGLFLWDHMLAAPGMAVADPWVVMAAVAAGTSRIRMGALVTPLPRRRPWVLSRQMATLGTPRRSFRSRTRIRCRSGELFAGPTGSRWRESRSSRGVSRSSPPRAA